MFTLTIGILLAATATADTAPAPGDGGYGDSPELAGGDAMTPAPTATADLTCTNAARASFAIGPYAATILSDGVFTRPFTQEDAFYLDDVSVLMRTAEAHYLPLDTFTLGRNVLYLDTGDDKIIFDAGALQPAVLRRL